MNHNCPHCAANLSTRLVRSKPLRGEARFLPLQAHMVCPKCGGGLEMNLHLVEEKLNKNSIWLVLPGIVGIFLENIWLMLLASVLIMLVAGYVSWFTWRNLKSWPRYKPYEAGKQNGPNK